MSGTVEWYEDWFPLIGVVGHASTLYGLDSGDGESRAQALIRTCEEVTGKKLAPPSVQRPIGFVWPGERK